MAGRASRAGRLSLKRRPGAADTDDVAALRILLCASGGAGLEVARYLAGRDDAELALLAVAGLDAERDAAIAEAAGAPRVLVGDLRRDPAATAEVVAGRFDALVSVYWPFLFTTDVLGAVGLTVNFHPALLPVNRGWYPHVHSILDGSPCGVTLHAMDGGADTGPIWAQEAVPVEPTDTALEVHARCAARIVDLFRRTWPRIAAGEVAPTPQDEAGAVYHTRREVDALDRIDPDAPTTARALVDLLRARSFGERGFAYLDGDEPVYLHLRLSRDGRLGPA